MGSPNHGLSPVLPGAWASTWTLSPEHGSLDAEKTFRLSQSQMSDSDTSSLSWQHRESPGPAPSKIHDSNASVATRNASIPPNAHIDDAETSSIDDDDSSVTSEDFYSFISEQDTDSTLLSSSAISGSLAKDISSDGLLGPLDFSCSHFDSSELSSASITPASEDVLVSDASILEAPVADNVRISEGNMSFDMDDNINRPASPLGYCLPNISACGQQLTASEPIDIITRRMSNGSPVDSSGYECDSASAHSDYSDINYVGISNLITRLDSDNASRASDISWSQSSPREVRRQSRRRDDIQPQLSSQPSNLLLSQPDGDNPWTLFLDPTLTSTESEAASQSSTTSLSFASSLAFDGDRTSLHIVTPSPSLRQPFRPTGKPNPPTTSLPPQQGIQFPVYGLQEPLQSAFIESGPSTATFNPRNDSIRTKNFLQKTRKFCNKFKKMITLKAKKERKVPEIREAPTVHRTPLHSRCGLDITPPVRNFSQVASHSFSSTERYSPFPRTTKVSSPSVALSYTPEYTVKRSMQSSGEFAYEHQGGPNPLQEMRSKRRFSLPAFGGPFSSSRPSTSSGSPSKLSGTSLLTMRRKAGSILSADGRTMR